MLKDFVLIPVIRWLKYAVASILVALIVSNSYGDAFDLRIVHKKTQNFRVSYSLDEKLKLSPISVEESVFGSAGSQGRLLAKPSKILEPNVVQLLHQSLKKFNPCAAKYPNAVFDSAYRSVDVSPNKSWVLVELNYRKLAVYDRTNNQFTNICENGWKGYYWEADNIGITSVDSGTWPIEEATVIKQYSLVTGLVNTVTFNELPILNFILLDHGVIVAAVETSSSRSLFGLLAALAGHGVTKRQIELRVWDPRTNNEENKVLGGFDNPAVFMTSLTSQ